MYETATLAEALQDGMTTAQVLQNLKLRVKSSTGVQSPLEKGSYIVTHFPQMAADTIRLADEALAGEMVLPGTGPGLHFIGNPPLWNDQSTGDNEYTFHLNRMHHWKTLCEAYTLTGDLRYGQKAIDELLDWMEKNPCPALHNPDGSYAPESFDGLRIWRALEVGIRGYRTWPLVIELLIDSGLITEQLLEKLLPCVYLHCRVLYEISPLLWPRADHNHYLMENLGLLSFACLFPELRDSQLFAEHAQRELDRCIDAQCTPCGGQIEGCPSYHNGCVFWFALRLVLADKYHLEVSEHYSGLVRSMFQHAVHATRACGGNFPWGDSHGYREGMALSAVSCYMAFGERDYLSISRHFYSLDALMREFRDNLWRLRHLDRLQADLAWANSHPKQPDYDTFAWQRDLDQVYFRSDWSKNALSIMTGCRTPVQNLHAHIDAGGFDFTAYGAPLISDPGIFTYKDCEARHWFKGSMWHNCLTVNGQDMWEYRSSWSYGPQREGSIVHAASQDGLVYALSRHHNYSPAVATRLLAMVDNRMLLVLDLVEGLAPKSMVQIGFHLDRTAVTICSDGTALTEQPEVPNLRLISCGAQDSVALEDAQISTSGDVSHPSRIVRYTKNLPEGGSYQQATLILPCPAGAQPPSAEQPVVTAQNGGWVIALTVEGVTRKIVLCDDKATLEKEF